MRREAGFSLLEVLVALALLAIIGASIVQTTSLAANVWRRTETFSEKTELAQIREKLRLWLETMKSPNALVGLRSEPEGDRKTFTFLTTTVLPISDALSEARITITAGDDEGLVTIELVRRSGDIVHTEERRLTDAPIYIRYYDKIERDWLDEWSVVGRLPDLISIEVSGEPSESWPPLIVAPLVTQRL